MRDAVVATGCRLGFGLRLGGLGRGGHRFGHRHNGFRLGRHRLRLRRGCDCLELRLGFDGLDGDGLRLGSTASTTTGSGSASTASAATSSGSASTASATTSSGSASTASATTSSGSASTASATTSSGSASTASATTSSGSASTASATTSSGSASTASATTSSGSASTPPRPQLRSASTASATTSSGSAFGLGDHELRLSLGRDSLGRGLGDQLGLPGGDGLLDRLPRLEALDPDGRGGWDPLGSLQIGLGAGRIFGRGLFERDESGRSNGSRTRVSSRTLLDLGLVPCLRLGQRRLGLGDFDRFRPGLRGELGLEQRGRFELGERRLRLDRSLGLG